VLSELYQGIESQGGDRTADADDHTEKNEPPGGAKEGSTYRQLHV
jgi:hypothetical protein